MNRRAVEVPPVLPLRHPRKQCRSFLQLLHGTCRYGRIETGTSIFRSIYLSQHPVDAARQGIPDQAHGMNMTV